MQVEETKYSKILKKWLIYRSKNQWSSFPLLFLTTIPLFQILTFLRKHINSWYQNQWLPMFLLNNMDKMYHMKPIQNMLTPSFLLLLFVISFKIPVYNIVQNKAKHSLPYLPPIYSYMFLLKKVAYSWIYIEDTMYKRPCKL